MKTFRLPVARLSLALLILGSTAGCGLLDDALQVFVAKRVFFTVDAERQQCLTPVGIPDGLENPKAFVESDLKVLANANASETDTTAALASTMLGYQSAEVHKIADINRMFEDVIGMLDSADDCTDCNDQCKPGDSNCGGTAAAYAYAAILHKLGGASLHALAATTAPTTDTTSGGSDCETVVEYTGAEYETGFTIDFSACKEGGGSLEILGNQFMVDMVTGALSGTMPADFGTRSGSLSIRADHMLAANNDKDCTWDNLNQTDVCTQTLTGYTEIHGSIGVIFDGVSFSSKRSNDNAGKEVLDEVTVAGTVKVSANTVKLGSIDGTDPAGLTVAEAALDGGIELHLDGTIAPEFEGTSLTVRALDLNVQNLVLESFQDPALKIEFSGQLSGSADFLDEAKIQSYEDRGDPVPAGTVDKGDQKINIDGLAAAMVLSNSKGSVELAADLHGTARYASTQSRGSDSGSSEGSGEFDFPCESVVLKVNSNDKGSAEVSLSGYGQGSMKEKENWDNAGSQRFNDISVSTVRIDVQMGDLPVAIVIPELTINEANKDDTTANKTDKSTTIALKKSYMQGKGGQEYYIYTDPSMISLKSSTWNQNGEQSQTANSGKLILEGLDRVEMENPDTQDGGMIVHLNGALVEP